jgi:hypothetical protein
MQECDEYMIMMHACSVRPYKLRKNLSSINIHSGIHTLSHARTELVGLHVCAVSVPAQDIILAQTPQSCICALQKLEL